MSNKVIVTPNSTVTMNGTNIFVKQSDLDKKQNINDIHLETLDKTIVGGINELVRNAELDLPKKQDKLENSGDTYIDNGNEIRVYTAPEQPVALDLIINNDYKVLTTNSKTIVGAINELNNKLTTLLNVIKGQ